MKYTLALMCGIMATAMTMIGCDSKSGTKPPPPAVTGKATHDHGDGPNGGVVFDFGANHAEFTVDHDKKECMVFVLGGDETTPTAVAATELTLVTKETKTKDRTVVPPMTISLKPQDTKDGKAIKFVGADAGLGNVADFAGVVTGEIDGRPTQGDFQE